MSPPPNTRVQPYTAVMAECSRILRQHANKAMATLHQTLTVEVDTLWRQTYDANQSETLGELLRALMRADDAVPREFASALENRMSERIRHPQETTRSYRAQSAPDIVLSLLDDVVFSESLLIGNLARSLHNTSENELRELMPRISVMLGIEDEVDNGRNPLAP
jgi:hypothetical protein